MKEASGAKNEEGIVLEIKRIGNSTGFILPRELHARLKLKEGANFTSWTHRARHSS